VLSAELSEALIATLKERPSASRSAALEAPAEGYFELSAILAHRMMANGKENAATQRTFSNKIQSLVSRSGRKLILTIFSSSFLSKIRKAHRA
jgi:hypothetical protein